MSKNEFDTAFDEEAAAPTEQDENAAFGIEPEAAAEPAPDVAGSAGEEPAMQGESEAAGAAGGEEAPAEPAPEPAAEPAADPADVQRQKSWEGRLKKTEAELKAREEALAAREAAISEKDGKQAAGMEPTPGESEETGEAAEAVIQAAREQSPELAAAMQKLKDDFGDEFVSMIQSVAQSAAKEAMGGLDLDAERAQVESVISALREEFNTAAADRHFDSIGADHPDFEEIADSEPFTAFVAGLPDDQRAAAERTIERGSSRSVVKLLDAYKASLDAQGDEVDPFSDAEEGVRSTAGVKLPSKPRAAKDDFASAWDDAG